MEKVIAIIFFGIISLFSYGQQKDCGLPACDLPGDPGVVVKKFTLNRPGNGKYFYLQSGPFAGDKILIELKNKSGKTLDQRTVDVSMGSVISVFNCSDLPAGSYRIVVKSRLPVKIFYIKI